MIIENREKDYSSLKPLRGDKVMACPHESGECHWIYLDPPAEVRRSDGLEGTSSWICLCTPCVSLPGKAIEKVTVIFTLEDEVKFELVN